ncbi:MAG: hypothetical protein ABIN24_11900 [Dyadobacter sp.]
MIFISNNWADAHQQTRLDALVKINLSILCLAVFRNYYGVDSQFKPIFIGNMEHASYRKRNGVYIGLFGQLRRNVVNKDFLYVFGFDLMLICLIFRLVSGKKIKVIYEVPDIREIFFSPSISGKLIRWIEKIAIPRIDLLVVTSPDFLSNYFIGLRKISIQDSLIIENKIHPPKIENSGEFIPQIYDQNRTITIGYFGVLRCPASLDFLIKLSKNKGFEVILRGIFMPATKHYEEVILGKRHIRYLGSYHPKDLNSIYSSVDIIWAVYPFSSKTMGNHILARTNRFYESLYFKKPFIVQKGTADSKKATLLGNIALEIDLENEKETIEFLVDNLTPDRLLELNKKLLYVPESHYQITNEYNDLEMWIQRNR